MRWNKKPETELGVWREWFAWYPALINKQWVWLERIERRRILNEYAAIVTEPMYDWDYRFKEMSDE